jgi:hypothetical protein
MMQSIAGVTGAIPAARLCLIFPEIRFSAQAARACLRG